LPQAEVFYPWSSAQTGGLPDPVNTLPQFCVYDHGRGSVTMASISGDSAGLPVATMELHAVKEPADCEAAENERLVTAARSGDRAAFGRLYDRFAPMVHGILLARVPLSEVDDLVHDVFLHAMPRLHSLRDIARFGPWLAAITRNRANDYYRQSMPEVELAEELPESAVEGRSRNAPDAETQAILAVIQELPETYRETLLLRLVEGMTGPEIATRTGMTHGSVRVNLHRGMQILREKLRSNQRGE
jgi:RNA polymerase sigma-70 factor, ECF subfamily